MRPFSSANSLEVLQLSSPANGVTTASQQGPGRSEKNFAGMASAYGYAGLAIGVVTILSFDGIGGAEPEGLRDCDDRLKRECHDFYLNPSYTDMIPCFPERARIPESFTRPPIFTNFGDMRIPCGRPPRGGWPVICILRVSEHPEVSRGDLPNLVHREIRPWPRSSPTPHGIALHRNRLTAASGP